MDDDRLRRELERRAARAAVPDFVSAVAPRLDSERAQPARVASWAPLAGLAAAAVIVVVLVIAGPRLGKGPAASASPMPFGFGTHDCGSVVNQVYDPSPVLIVDGTGAVVSCAAEHLNGAWRATGANVLVQPVDGAPDQIDVAWQTQECSPERVLLDLKPNNDGYALRVVVDRTGPDGYECVSTLQTGHAIVTLSHPVDAARVSSELILAPDATADLPKTVDCVALAGSGARVLTLVDHTGLVVGCSQVEAGSASTGNVDASNTTDFDSVRYRWLDQSCAGHAAADFEAVDGGYKFAVAHPSPTCAPGVPVAIVVDYQIPMPTELVTAEYAQPAPVLSCADTPYVTVVDEAGVVKSCASSESTASPGTDLVIANPDGDTTALQLSWVGSRCTYEVHFEPKDPYSIEIFNMSKACPLRDVVHTVTLQLTTPISADQITGWSIGGPPASSPPASPIKPTPPAGPTATGHGISCSDVMSLTDETGDVVNCADAGGRDYHSQDAHVSVDASDPRLLHIWWGQNDCTDSFEIRVSPAPSGLPQPADYNISVSTYSEPGCQPMGPDAHSASIDFASPVDASRIRLTINDHRLADPVVCAPAAGLVDVGDGVDIYDSTDLITSCTQTQPSADSAAPPTNLTDSSIMVRWTDRPCGVPIHLFFDSSADGFALSKNGQCMVNPSMTYEIVINFTQSMPAASVDASTVKLMN